MEEAASRLAQADPWGEGEGLSCCGCPSIHAEEASAGSRDLSAKGLPYAWARAGQGAESGLCRVTA